MTARSRLRGLGYTATGAALALAGSEFCMHMGRIQETADETVCTECGMRFADLDHLAHHGGWDLATRGWIR